MLLFLQKYIYYAIPANLKLESTFFLVNDKSAIFAR